ncbi:endo-1,4-beta-xylanase [Mucilaginibacter paludis]|uniref:Beta-xylanase n=1 Tax=Mucilaginibacter paludis DSM 18603 TaxID=714943 RepID=H1YFS9_9SPHI|nr:endo-1,4-beta-xylanase [Mucilaginibacter paludis]EHQ25320.1 glycoside hydrolase family 10 [Mucilaginibacter paludis DSM 18603]
MKLTSKRFIIMLLTVLTALFSLQFINYGSSPKITGPGKPGLQEQKGLKDYYKNYFPIGVAVNMAALNGQQAELINREFNSITPENDMKISVIHPLEGQYNWKNADAIVDFAVSHHIKIRGHNLLWHTQVPDWMFRDSTGALVSKEVLLRRLKDHITTVVKRYRGKIYAWDVVNEAIDDSPEKYLRNSLWYQICGEDFLAKAFEYAHEADPTAALYYNDYNSEDPSKREKIYRLLKNLKDAKVPIDGVGLQGHWKLNDPSPDLIRTALDRYSSLGLKIQITELDVTIREPRPRTNRPPDTAATMPVDSGYTERIARLQADRYQSIFQIFRDYKKVITSVTFWNLSDRYSWLDFRNGGLAGGAAASINTPRIVRKAYPLLFDENLQRKKAYWSVVNF